MLAEANLPESIVDLASYNIAALAVLGYSYQHRSWPESQIIGQAYLTSIYPDYNQPDLRRQRLNFPNNSNEAERLEASTLINQQHDIGLILVRPEMFHVRDKFAQFIKKFGFKINYEESRKIDARTYGALYNPTVDTEAAKPAWPTRTIVYLDSPAYLIIFTDPKKRFPSLADGFFKTYKGQEGVQEPDTLRGDIVFHEATKLGFQNLQNETLATALDPFTTLKNIIQLPGNQPHSHLPQNLTLLKYNGVSVHVPNSKEVITDLAILNSSYQLQTIYDLLEKH